MTETLIHGECLEQMALLPDASIDAIITDPPYGTTACKWDSVIPFEPMWEQLKRLIKPRGAIVLFGSQPFTSALIMSNVKWFKYCWVWDKVTATGGALAKTRPMKAHEDIIIFTEGTNYYPQWDDFTQAEIAKMRKHDFVCNNSEGMKAGTHISTGWFTGKRKHPKSIIRVNGITPVSREKQSGHHPTQKPVKLMEYLVKTYTLEGETVLDFTMGSGSTGVACKNTGRNFIGIEQDQGYCEIAQKRIAAAVRQLELGL